MKKNISILIVILFSRVFADTQIITKQEMANKDAPIQEHEFASIEESVGLDSFYDPSIDYSKFSGRLTDKDPSGMILKIYTESRNVKFFKPSDPVSFRVTKFRDKTPCKGNVRSIEKNYLTIYSKNLIPCWGELYNFRRGMLMIFESDRLAQRIKSASRYRVALLTKKRDFLYQLNDVNKFVWGFKQEQVKLAAEYDRKILELKKLKEEAINLLLSKKRDQIRIQRELGFRLDQIDNELKYYRVEKDELYTDRWHLDQNTGVPVYKKPVPVKVID